MYGKPKERIEECERVIEYEKGMLGAYQIASLHRLARAAKINIACAEKVKSYYESIKEAIDIVEGSVG